jgi:hypothetical protein
VLTWPSELFGASCRIAGCPLYLMYAICIILAWVGAETAQATRLPDASERRVVISLGLLFY